MMRRRLYTGDHSLPKKVEARSGLNVVVMKEAEDLAFQARPAGTSTANLLL